MTVMALNRRSLGGAKSSASSANLGLRHSSLARPAFVMSVTNVAEHAINLFSRLGAGGQGALNHHSILGPEQFSSLGERFILGC